MARTRREWIADCEFKRRHIEARKLATKEEVASFWPQRRAARLDVWQHTHSRLVRLLAREETRVSNLDHAEADAQIIRDLKAEPVTVQVFPPGHEPATVQVHPKNYPTLAEFFHTRDWLVGLLAGHLDVLREKGGFAHFELIERTSRELSRQYQALAWAACTEGPGLPAGITDSEPAIPEPFSLLAPADLLRIHEGYVRVNHLQLEALQVLVEPDGKASRERPSFSLFFSTLAFKLHCPVESLLYDRPLASLLAQVKLNQPPEPETAHEREKAAIAHGGA